MDALIYNRTAVNEWNFAKCMCESYKHNTERKKPYTRVYPVCFLLYSVSKLAKLVRKVVTFGKTKVVTGRQHGKAFALLRMFHFLI